MNVSICLKMTCFFFSFFQFVLPIFRIFCILFFYIFFLFFMLLIVGFHKIICRMVKRAMQQWLRAIITLLILLLTEGHPVDITYLQSAVAKGAGKNFFESKWLFLFLFLFFVQITLSRGGSNIEVADSARTHDFWVKLYI